MNAALTHLKQHDPVIGKLVDSFPAPELKKHTNYYHELASSIISQQLSIKAVRTIEGRFKDLFGGTFPAPEQILAESIETLRSAGLSGQKARYIQDLAAKIVDGTVHFSDIDQRSDDEIIAELTKVKGIGVWTVHMFLLFCMARPDVLPTGDLGIKNGIKTLYGFDHLPEPHEIEHLAEQNNWHPYSSTASWYIWRSLDNAPNL